MSARFVLDARHPVTRDHTVLGRHVLPGLAYVDVLWQGAAARHDDLLRFELRDVKIFRPLVVPADGAVTCDLDVAPEAGGSSRVTVRDAASNGGSHHEGEVYASARLCDVGRPSFHERLIVADAARSAAQVVDAESLYARCRARKLVHGDFMKVAGTVYVSDADIVADIRLGTAASAHANAVLFHPALLDGAAVCLGSGFNHSRQSDQRELLLPIAFESFRAAAPLRTACLARVRSASVTRLRDVTTFSIEFFDLHGDQVAELRHLTNKSVREGVLSTSPTPTRTQRQTTTPARGREQTLEQRICELIAAMRGCPVDQIGAGHGFFDLGVSSANLLELIAALEGELGSSLSPTLPYEYTTPATLAAHLAGQAGPTGTIRGSRPVGRLRDVATETLSLASNAEHAIAVIGMAIRCPGAGDVAEYWRNIKAGRDCITEIPATRWDVDAHYHAAKGTPRATYTRWGGFMDGVEEFDPFFFNMTARHAAAIDPQQRLFLETAWTVLETAGYTRRRLEESCGHAVGVYVGAMYQEFGAVMADAGAEEAAGLASYSAIANRVSYQFGLTGPSVAVDTMCASSATAVHMACRALRHRECALAIAGGVNLSLRPEKFVSLGTQLLLASRPDRRSFSEGDGFLPSEAVGAVLLKPLARAIEDRDSILAVVAGTASNHGGRSAGFGVPNLAAQSALIEEALADAGVAPRSVSYVEAAAAGSAMTDAIEAGALRKVFDAATTDRQFCAIGSVKSLIGHAEAASGITQLIKVILQLQHGEMAPSICAEPLNRDLHFEESAFVLQREARPWPAPRRALIDSFGAGGSNACLVVDEWPAEASLPDTTEPQLIVLSAPTADRLRPYAARLLRHVCAVDVRLADLAYTLQCGREPMPARVAFVVRDRSHLIAALEHFVEGSAAGDLDRADDDPLERLAASWVRGGDVDWQRLSRSDDVRIVPLPTQALQRLRCWPSRDEAPLVARVSRSTGTYVPPRTELERAIVSVWEDVLGLEGVGVEDSFLVLGGNSLSAVRIVARLRALCGLEVPIRTFITGEPTIAVVAMALVAQLAAAHDPAVVDTHISSIVQA